jgi:separase
VDNNGSSSNKQAETSASSDDSGAFPRRLSGTFENALDDAGKFDSNVDDDGGQDDGQEHDDLTSLTVPKLKDRLLQYGIPESFLRRKKKADLISLLVSLHQQQQTESHDDDDPTTSSEKNSSSDTCLFLILDENLHRFPFEGLPHLVGRTVCRVPCLSFVLATLYENQADPISKLVRCVEPRRTSFVLDPENNLLSTRDRLLPMLRDITANQGWDWDGVVGQVPSPAFFARTLTTSNGMLLYFGHGGAQSYFSRRRVEELIDGRANAFRGDSSGVYDADASDDSDVDRALDHGTAHHQSTKACKAVVVLMGCSSGRLVSVNRKNTETLEEAPLYYEPEGVALSYLCAGAPCVVGNLWDVTDHDIDRFSVSMLEHFLGRRGVEKDDHNAAMSNNSLSVGKSLAASVSISRSACKLRYLVGCAPVCYGIPVHLMSGEGGER